MTWRKSSKCDSGSCVEVDFKKSRHCDTGTCVEVGFQKSSYCDSRDCVEVGFKKPSKCDNGQCVEVQCQCHEDKVLVRDSKQVTQVGEAGPYDVLTFSAGDWRQFLADVPARSRG